MAQYYCQYAQSDPYNKDYHDNEYGYPLREDAVLFERLSLEINQAGLSWITILKKKENFHRAFDGFHLDRVAAYGESEIHRLMNDAGIIRNRRKIQAVIENARRLIRIRQEFGSFAGWLDHHHPLQLEEWVKIFKQNLVFMGPEVVREFLVSIGYLPEAHEPSCPAYQRIILMDPPWLTGKR
jgi:DNA-3-methyladenine glycosylase I